MLDHNRHTQSTYYIFILIIERDGIDLISNSK